MTTQEKTAAIKEIITNREDNRNAVQAANVDELLRDLVAEAVNNAFKADLENIFAVKAATARKGN
jgi:ribosomal protein S3AE